MKIKAINTYLQPFQLTRPYTIAYKTQTAVENVIVEMWTDDGICGLGAASPAVEVTGETHEATLTALHPDQLSWCLNKDMRDFAALRQRCFLQLSKMPAACAAVDIALHDLYAQMLDRPLVAVLGQCHQALPTSITIGIKNVEETLKEASEYLERGFTHLKVKLGCDLQEDIERIIALRKDYGSHITIRVDPNQGYALPDLNQFIESTDHLDIELIEQPLSVRDLEALCRLKEKDRKRIALDESVLNHIDAYRALTTVRCGILNIKLMKCGGIFEAQKIAALAEAAQVKLMWGCMDESVISIAAALHVAFSCPATQYIDLDGSLDLAEDVVAGGFKLEHGILSPLDLPGLGLTRICGRKNV